MVGRLDNSGTGDLPMYLLVLGIFILLLLLVVVVVLLGELLGDIKLDLSHG